MQENILSFEEIIDKGILCTYCPVPKESQGVHLSPSGISMCEGNHCSEAYDNYLEEENEEHAFLIESTQSFSSLLNKNK